LGSDAPLSLYFGFHGRDFPENSRLEPSTHALEMKHLWLRSVNNQRHFTWRAMFLSGCISAFIEDIYLKIQFCLSISTRYKCSKFCCDRSLIQGTLVGEHCAFFGCISASIGVRFLKSHTSYSVHALQKMRILLRSVNN